MSSFFRRVRSLKSGGRSQSSPSQKSRVRLKLEELENRVAPAIFIVNNLGDAAVSNFGDAPGTLRQAIFDANNTPGDDIIQFQPGLSGTILLTEGELQITDNVEIQGSGANNLAISGNNTSRIFKIADNSENSLDVSIDGLTLTGGNSSAGGAIFIENENVLISRSMIAGNTASGLGGGIFYGGFDASGGSGGSGGSGELFLLDSTIFGNTAIDGGGIYLDFIDNSFRGQTPATIRNSTISGNSATGFFLGDSLIGGNGGGIYLADGIDFDLRVENSTITANEAAFRGGGIFLEWGDATLHSTIVANNTAGDLGNDLFGSQPSLYFTEFSLIRDTSGANIFETVIGSNLFNVDPLLGPLANNGGPTLTHALQYGSPAIDRGDNFQELEFDQRGEGFPRVVGSGPDIGAIEAGLTATLADSLAVDLNGNGIANPGDVIQYLATILNLTGENFFDMQFDASIDPNTTEVPGSIKVTPIAVDDDYFIEPEGTVTDNVLDNDFDPDDLAGIAAGRVLVSSFSRVDGDVTGSLTLNADGSFTYEAPDALGFEVFEYFITDADGLSNVIAGFITFFVAQVAQSLPPDSILLSQGELDFIVDAARQRWVSTGLTAAQVAALYQTQFVVADLNGGDLAALAASKVYIDSNAAGLGWFVDWSPFQDDEFSVPHSVTRLSVPGTSPLASQMDLLTVVMNQMGRLVGINPSLAPDLLSTPAAGVRNLLPGENIISALEQVFADHGFRFHHSYYQNWLGQNEKWFVDRNDQWHFVTPNGSIYRWNGGTFAGSTLVATIDPFVHADPTRLFHAPVRPTDLGLSHLAQLQRDHGFSFGGSYYQNWLGQNEKWFMDRNDQWHFVIPNGTIYRWNGGTFAGSTLVNSVPSAIYSDPTILFHTPPALAEPVRQLLSQLQMQHGFYFEGSYYQDWLGQGEKWFVDRNGHWHFITPNGNLYRWNGINFASSALLSSLDSLVFTVPELLFNAPVSLPAGQLGQLVQLQETYGFHFTGSYHQNWLGLAEKWFQDRDNQWYFITSAGNLYRWGGAGFGGSTLIAQLDSLVNTDPSALVGIKSVLTVFQGSGPLTGVQLDFIVAAAKQRWIDTGLGTEQLAALHSLTFEITNLPGRQLGSFNNGHIRIDVDAAGHGWFVDVTPFDDVEFNSVLSPTRRTADPLSAPSGRVDLLTVVMHEIGHALGLPDLYSVSDRDNLMYGYLGINERRLPFTGQANGAIPGTITHEEFLTNPVFIGMLPAFKGVQIYYQTQVNSPLPAGVTEVASQGIITAEFLESVLTDDPKTPEFGDPTRTPVEDDGSGDTPPRRRSLWLPV